MRKVTDGFAVMIGVAAATMLCGCSANYNSIKRTQGISGGTMTFIDAKQRAIIDRNNKICTEPPPDVFSVYAQSLAASGSASKGTDPTTLGVSGSIASASSETGSTISRTQAYNLLALQAYYNCLSSLNKDSGPLDAPIDRVRLQRLIVSTIAVEQLTGALRPHVVVIGAGGSAGSGGSAEVMKTLAQARKDDLAAQQALKAAQGEEAALEATDPKCSALAVRVKAGETLTGADLTKQENCKKAETKTTEAKTASDAATQFYQAQLASAGSGMSSAADAKPGEAKMIEVGSARSEQTIVDVANAVKEIVKYNFESDDETKFFCMRVLFDDNLKADTPTTSPGATRDLGNSCAALLLTDVQSRADPALLSRYVASYSVVEQDITAAFNRFWPKVATAANQPDIARVSGLLDPQITDPNNSSATRQRLQALKVATDEATARAAFALLPPDIRTTLAR